MASGFEKCHSKRRKHSETSDFSDLKILSDEIIHVDNVRDRLSQYLNIKLPPQTTSPESVDDLMNLAQMNKGNCRLLFHLPNSGSPKPLRVLAHNIKVSTNSIFIKKLRSKYGKDNVWIE